MPHLSEIQAKYADDGVTIIGMTKSDRRGNTLSKVKAMVEKKGDTMAYTVGWDKGRATWDAYMTASGNRGIPTAFLIDRKGRIAFIGHPFEMDQPLARVVAGTWDPAVDGARLAEAKAAQDALRKELSALGNASRDSVKGKDADALLQSWDHLAKEHPATASQLGSLHYRVLIAAGKYVQAAPIGRAVVDAAVKAGDANALNQIAWDVVDPLRNLDQRDLMLGLYAATISSNLESHKNPGILDTLAWAHFRVGDIKRSVEIQTRAVALAPETMKASLRDSLEKFEEASKG